MCIPELLGAEPRLRLRFQKLVVSHLHPRYRVAAGLQAPPDLNGPMAAAQAAWRFYGNERMTLPQLAGPLVECARQGAWEACDAYTLVVMDWSPLHYGGHESKRDRVKLAHGKDLGYNLLTALLVSDRDGSPIAPLCLELESVDGVYSTRSERLLPTPSRLDGLGPVIAHVTGLLTGLPAGTGHRLPARPAARAGPAGPAGTANPAGREPVFVIDREADSVGHYRRWDRAGRKFVVRADDKRLVLHEGTQRNLPAVVALLKRRRAFAEARRVEFKGRLAVQFVAETTVVLHRPARQHRVDRKTGKRNRRDVPGKPLPLRLIVSEVRDEHDVGKVLARWLLLTNLPAPAAAAATVALWYYWRWRIEGYHKLLKGAGQEIECWQQEHADPLSRRLLVAAMSAVVVWKLARDDRPEAAEMRDVLMRLSGRQVKRCPAPDGSPARGFTEPALLAGLGVLIPMLHLLATHDLNDLRRTAHAALPGLFPDAIRARRDTG